MKEKINEIIHSKKIIVILIIVLIVLVGAASTYAWFTWSSTNNASLTMSIGELADVNFSTGNDITTNSLSPVFNYTDGEKTTFSINNKTDTEISYKVLLNITSIADELKSSSLKYKLLSGTTVVAEGDFSNITSNSSTSIYNGTLGNESASFTFYLYIDGNIENDLSMMGKSLSGNITVTAEEKIDVEITALTTLNRLNEINGGNLNIDTRVPDFNVDSYSDNTVGLYESTDDFGTSYYFRGEVENNYVKFANFYWRIIRINGDGTIRMIYAGSSPHENGYDDSSSRDMDIGDEVFNYDTNDNTYVGYMTGTAGASTYDETHSNTEDSYIKMLLDGWYSSTISNTNDEKYVADAIYCNDRSVSDPSSEGFGDADTTYGFGMRFANPTLMCANKNDRFMIDNIFGNGKLEYPIGLITMDEVNMAGIDYANGNNTYYLFSNVSFWTMTPRTKDIIVYIHSGGVFGDAAPNTSDIAVRPVISLKYDAISSGSGTSSDPYIVES